MEVNGTWRRLARPIGELTNTVNEVDSSLEAICELLQHASDARVHAGGIHALLRPLQVKLNSAANQLNDLPI